MKEKHEAASTNAYPLKVGMIVRCIDDRKSNLTKGGLYEVRIIVAPLGAVDAHGIIKQLGVIICYHHPGSTAHNQGNYTTMQAPYAQAIVWDASRFEPFQGEKKLNPITTPPTGSVPEKKDKPLLPEKTMPLTIHAETKKPDEKSTVIGAAGT